MKKSLILRLGNSNAKVAIKAAMDRDPKLHVTIPFDVSM